MSVIVTSIVTCIVLILKIALTLVQYAASYDINRLMMLRNIDVHKGDYSTNKVWFAFFLHQLNIIIQLTLMEISIENVNFKCFVIRLLQGRNLLDLMSRVSYFIIVVPRLNSVIEDSQSSTLMNSNWREHAELLTDDDITTDGMDD